MSCFMSCMPPDGLIEMPPESKVTPLPTTQIVGRVRPPRRRVLEHDQPRRVRAALAHREQGAHLELLQLRDVEDAAGEPDLLRDLARLGRERRAAGARWPARSRAGARRSGIPRASRRARRRRGRRAGRASRSTSSVTRASAGGGVLLPGLPAVGPVAGEHRALGDRRRRLRSPHAALRRGSGDRERSHAGARAAATARPPRRRNASASSLASSPTPSQHAPAGARRPRPRPKSSRVSPLRPRKSPLFTTSAIRPPIARSTRATRCREPGAARQRRDRRAPGDPLRATRLLRLRSKPSSFLHTRN